MTFMALNFFRTLACVSSPFRRRVKRWSRSKEAWLLYWANFELTFLMFRSFRTLVGNRLLQREFFVFCFLYFFTLFCSTVTNANFLKRTNEKLCEIYIIICRQKEFQNLIAPFRVSNDDENARPGVITDSELIAQKEKTNRQLRTAELLRQHSMEADLVVLWVFQVTFFFSN